MMNSYAVSVLEFLYCYARLMIDWWRILNQFLYFLTIKNISCDNCLDKRMIEMVINLTS